MNLKEFLLAEIEKDEAEAKRALRFADIARMQAWEEGRQAGIAGATYVENPYTGAYAQEEK